MQSAYTPQIGCNYLVYASETKKYQKSHMSEIKRALYVFNCLTIGKPILKWRTQDMDVLSLSGKDGFVPSIPLTQLHQLILNWQDDVHGEVLAKGTIYIFEHLVNFVGLSSYYTPEIGKGFLEQMKEKNFSDEYIRSFNRKIYLLDCFTTNEPIKILKAMPRIVVAPIFASVLDEYKTYCQRTSNKESTVDHKRRYASKFLNNIDECGCQNLSELTPHIVLRACLIKPITGCFTYYRVFLKYLADIGITMVDYSPLVPKDRKSTKLPDVYSKEEILKLEAAYDRETDRGKRDYAMVLLASRLKLRPSDIVSLQFEEVNFETDHIQLIQQKTDYELILPIVPEVKEALLDYIRVRPQSDSPYVFLRTHAPYLPMGSASVYDITTKGFNKADVKPDGRSTGPKSLRSSGATHMINGGESYKAVQDSLGQKNKNVIQHYARLDIPHLRMNALKPQTVTDGSFFDLFLKGEVSL